MQVDELPTSGGNADALGRLDELRRLDREAAVARVAAVIAHAVGTPLNVIVGRAGLIRSSPDATESIIREVECIERKVEQLAQRLRAAVDFYALANSSPSSCCLSEVISEAASLYGPIARAKGITLRITETDFPVNHVDQTLTSVVLTNLLSLAVSEAARDTVIELGGGYLPEDDRHVQPACLWFGLGFNGAALPSPKPIERLEFPESLGPHEAHQHQVLMLSSSMLRSVGGRLEIVARNSKSTFLKAMLPIRR